MAPTATLPNHGSSSARFRQRKVSVKQDLRVYWQKDIPELDDDAQRDPIVLETGVEKGEEEEHHLQAVLNASNAAISDNKQRVPVVFIPTPEANQPWKEYKKYYKPDWIESESYIRQSATVEDTSGCPYNMDEVDTEFLDTLNSSITESKSKCSENEFEMIAYLLESTTMSKQPFLATDPSQLLDYKELEIAILERVAEHEKDPLSVEKLLSKTKSSVFTTQWTPSPFRTVPTSFKEFGQKVYTHWRARKLERGGKSVFPSIKFESDAEKDENDPYVCFRHREVRLARKTRRTDQQSNERLRRLQLEMIQANRLFKMVASRETLRMQVIQNDWDVFEQQCKVKSLKRKLGISNEEEDLLTAFKKKKEERKLPTGKRMEEREKEKLKAAAAGAAGAAGAAVSGADGQRDTNSPSQGLKVVASKIPDLELVTLEQLLHDKDMAAKTLVKTRLKARSQADKDWVNYSDNPFVPYYDYFDPELSQYEQDLNTRLDKSESMYSSIASSFPAPTDTRVSLPLSSKLGKAYASRADVEPHVLWSQLNLDGTSRTVRDLHDRDITPGSQISVPRFSSASFRKRIGRLGLHYIDRKGIVRKPATSSETGEISEAEERLADRFKFDNENTVEHMSDAFNDPARLNGISEETQLIRFGSMLLSKSYETFQEAQLLRQQQVQSKQQRYAQMLKESAAQAEAAAAAAAGNGPVNGAANATASGTANGNAGAGAGAGASGPGASQLARSQQVPLGNRANDNDAKRLTTQAGWSPTTTFTSSQQANGSKALANQKKFNASMPPTPKVEQSV